MINAKELRIGNWFFNGLSNSIVDESIFSCFSDTRRFHVDLFEPIPLTEEWLVRFGFEKFGDTWVNKKCEIPYVYFDDLYENNSIEYTAGEGVSRSVPIKHVHQLQNLYFALTGTELEIIS